MSKLFEVLKEKGFLSETADSTALDSAAAEIITEQVTAQTGSIIKNRDDLLTEKKTLKKQYDSIVEKYSFVDEGDLTPETYADLKAELDDYRSKGSDGDLDEKLKEKYELGKKTATEALQPKLNKLEDDLRVSIQGTADVTSKFHSYKAENAVRKVLAGTGANYSPTWFKGLMSDIKVEAKEDGSLDISLPYKDQGSLPLTDWGVAWSQSDEAKRMMPANANKGGGANGGSGGGDNTPSIKDTLNSMFN